MSKMIDEIYIMVSNNGDGSGTIYYTKDTDVRNDERICDSDLIEIDNDIWSIAGIDFLPSEMTELTKDNLSDYITLTE